MPIDHVVPLAAAWMRGAQAWPADKRAAFANDLNYLIATTRDENSAQADSTADEWVHDDRTYRCSYATVVITVKSRYVLTVTPAEAAELRSLLVTCCRSARHHPACAVRRGALRGTGRQAT